MEDKVKYVVREQTLFAGIRKPIKSRAELIPRIQEVSQACGDRAIGPLVHIFRFDTPVDGFDSEIGYPVEVKVDSGEVRTHTLREMHFFSLMHKGSPETLRNTTLKIFEHMKQAGLSSELELMEEDMEVNFITDDELNLHEIVREQLYLSVPIKSLCKEECLGLCAKCGCNLNKHSCECVKEQGHPGFSVLNKLKN